MPEDLHLTLRDVARLRQALAVAREDDDRPVTLEEAAAAGLDTPEGQARLERLWQTFLSASATAPDGQPEDLAMKNENAQPRKDPAPGIEYNLIPDAWYVDAALRENVDVRGLVNPITDREAVPQEGASGIRSATRSQTPEK
jgi:hypothetical protein